MPGSGHTTLGRKSVAAIFASLIVASLATALACSTWSSGGDESEADDGPVVATVDGTTIRLADLDERIRQALFEREFGDDASSLYEARRSTIEEMIDERLVTDAAAAAGTTPDQYLDSALAALPPVSDGEIEQLFDENRARLPAEATLEDYADQIRAHLDERRIEQVFAQLRKASEIQISVPQERAEVVASGPGLGPVDAPLVIVEFSDFQCPFCARAVPILKALHERHPDDLRIVYRHMPLSFHEHARLAAIGGVCADRQNRFWEYHDALFADQSAISRDDLIARASTLGLEPGDFASCLDDPAAAAIVDQDAADAEALGLTGTPTFFVNGLKLTGARPVEHFEAVLVEETARLAP